jgi:hypothetical protein
VCEFFRRVLTDMADIFEGKSIGGRLIEDKSYKVTTSTSEMNQQELDIIVIIKSNGGWKGGLPYLADLKAVRCRIRLSSLRYNVNIVFKSD